MQVLWDRLARWHPTTKDRGVRQVLWRTILKRVAGGDVAVFAHQAPPDERSEARCAAALGAGRVQSETRNGSHYDYLRTR